jgi:hypothetical protein
MLKEELIKRSPIRILEKSIHGGLGRGNLGVFTGRKGVGKTASLIHVAMDKLLREQHVVHLTFADNAQHIENWYKQVFQEVSDTYKLEQKYDIYDQIKKYRLILHFKQTDIPFEQLEKDIGVFYQGSESQPQMYIVDGYPFPVKSEDDFRQWKQLAEKHNLEIWFSATLHREDLALDQNGIPSPVNRFTELFSVIIMLHPESDYIDFKLLKDHDSLDLEKLRLQLDPKTLLIATHHVKS